VWKNREQIADNIARGLCKYDAGTRKLPGIVDQDSLRTLAWQFVASLRRLEYTELLKQRPIDLRRANPNDALFDPERAAILHSKNGDLDEAFWVVFLATHFGKHRTHGWRRLRDVYSGLGVQTWTWARVAPNPQAFRQWLRQNSESIGGAFGNHRKYESLSAASPNGTAEVVESYVRWVSPPRTHSDLVSTLVRAGGNDPQAIFREFYQSMNVRRFGRLGKFDFLALIGKLGLAPISPDATYLGEATGPRRGAKLLFGGSITAPIPAPQLEAWISELDDTLHVGMQAMEDALCNWQKSPKHFIHFKG
jgi:hypothetical protein